MLAAALYSCECQISNRHWSSWDKPLLRRYFAWLEEHGYQLVDIERTRLADDVDEDEDQ